MDWLSPTSLTNEKSAYLGWTLSHLFDQKNQLTGVGLSPTSTVQENPLTLVGQSLTFVTNEKPAFMGWTLPIIDQWKISLLGLGSLEPLWPMKNQLTWVGLSRTSLTNEKSAYLGWTLPIIDQWKISLLGLGSLEPLWPLKISLLGLDFPSPFWPIKYQAYLGSTLAHLSSPGKSPAVCLLASRCSCYSYNSDHYSHHANYLQCHHGSSRHGHGFWQRNPWIITSHDILMHHCSTNFQ